MAVANWSGCPENRALEQLGKVKGQQILKPENSSRALEKKLPEMAEIGLITPRTSLNCFQRMERLYHHFKNSCLGSGCWKPLCFDDAAEEVSFFFSPLASSGA